MKGLFFSDTFFYSLASGVSFMSIGWLEKKIAVSDKVATSGWDAIAVVLILALFVVSGYGLGHFASLSTTPRIENHDRCSTS